jgi:hypothetical protein
VEAFSICLTISSKNTYLPTVFQGTCRIITSHPTSRATNSNGARSFWQQTPGVHLNQNSPSKMIKEMLKSASQSILLCHSQRLEDKRVSKSVLSQFLKSANNQELGQEQNMMLLFFLIRPDMAAIPKTKCSKPTDRKISYLPDLELCPAPSSHLNNRRLSSVFSSLSFATNLAGSEYITQGSDHHKGMRCDATIIHRKQKFRINQKNDYHLSQQ